MGTVADVAPAQTLPATRPELSPGRGGEWVCLGQSAASQCHDLAGALVEWRALVRLDSLPRPRCQAIDPRQVTPYSLLANAVIEFL